MYIAYDLREVLFQQRGWYRYGVNFVRQAVTRERDNFLLVVENRELAIASYPFLDRPNTTFLEEPIDRSFDSQRYRHPAIEDVDLFHSLTEFPEFEVSDPKLVVTVHDVGFRACPQHLTDGLIRAARYAFDYTAQRADLVFVFTEWVGELYSRFVEDCVFTSTAPVIQIPFGLDHVNDYSALTRKKTSNTSTRCLYFGAADPDKNLDLLITAYIDSGVFNSVHLVLAGPGCDQLTSRLPVATRRAITCLPYVGESHLAELVQSSAFCVFPSLDEGLGLGPLEAAVLGTPSLCSDIPPFRETMGNSARYFEASSALDLGRALHSMTREFGDCRATLEKFPPPMINNTWKECVHQSFTGYQGIRPVVADYELMRAASRR